MVYQYLKALHIIFVVTWFAALFYMPRLLIYNTEANEKEEPEKQILHKQFTLMMKRLWFGIALPSAILTLIFGTIVLFTGNWDAVLFHAAGRWLLIKLCFVLLLIAYHFSLQKIYHQQTKNIFKYTSQQLRIWNEVATIFLFAIVMLATVKESVSLVWGGIMLVCLIIILLIAIKLYKNLRRKK